MAVTCSIERGGSFCAAQTPAATDSSTVRMVTTPLRAVGGLLAPSAEALDQPPQPSASPRLHAFEPASNSIDVAGSSAPGSRRTSDTSDSQASRTSPWSSIRERGA